MFRCALYAQLYVQRRTARSTHAFWAKNSRADAGWLMTPQVERMGVDWILNTRVLCAYFTHKTYAIRSMIYVQKWWVAASTLEDSLWVSECCLVYGLCESHECVLLWELIEPQCGVWRVRLRSRALRQVFVCGCGCQDDAWNIIYISYTNMRWHQGPGLIFYKTIPYGRRNTKSTNAKLELNKIEAKHQIMFGVFILFIELFKRNQEIIASNAENNQLCILNDSIPLSESMW